jgi:acetyl-CoA acetyltransferase
VGIGELRDQFAIVGVGVTPTAQTDAGGRSAQELEAWAVKLAMSDAGLTRSDIDGAILAFHKAGSDAYTRKLGLTPNFLYCMERMAGTIASVFLATQMIATGNANYVVVSAGLTWLSQARRLREQAGSGTVQFDKKFSMARDGGGLVDMGWTATPGAASLHGFYASRHMHEHGTTHEQFGAVALAHREWASRNPEARFYGQPLTLERYLGSRWVAHPYRLLDNCVVTDIGGAVIVTSADRAKTLRKAPVFIKGIGFGDGARAAWWDKSNFSRTDSGHARDVAFREAGITISEVDVANLYDCFTGEVIMAIEDYGFCERGEGGPFVESGATRPGGTHPMNTHGGLMSAYHCGDMGNVIESVRQLRGECGERQVQDAQIALADGRGWELILPYMCPISGTLVLGADES